MTAGSWTKSNIYIYDHDGWGNKFCSGYGQGDGYGEGSSGCIGQGFGAFNRGAANGAGIGYGSGEGFGNPGGNGYGDGS